MLCVIRLALRPGMLGRLVSAVLLVLASLAFDPDDYIRDREAFAEALRGRR